MGVLSNLLIANGRRFFVTGYAIFSNHDKINHVRYLERSYNESFKVVDAGY